MSKRTFAECGTMSRCDWCDEPPLYLVEEGTRARRTPACEAHAREWLTGCDWTPIVAIEVFFDPESRYPKTGRRLSWGELAAMGAA